MSRLKVSITNFTENTFATVTPANALKIDGSAVTQPVSATSLPLPTGAATEASLAEVNTNLETVIGNQPALGTAGTASSDVITVQGIASMTALKVDGSAVTQPVSATSLPLPTGAATETTLSEVNTNLETVIGNQPALGTAGTASSDVITVQGIASMTALKVDGSAVTQPVSATSLPLPTGAATEASLLDVITDLDSILDKQPAPGTAGSASSDVISIQGIASMTPLLVEFANPAAGGATEETLLDVLDKQPSLGTAGIASSDVITVQGIASMTALKVDGSDVTQPVSATSLPLPTGAATEASLLDVITELDSLLDKQPALGTAGTASSDVITVQGIASMTALKVDGSAVTQPVSATILPLPTGAATETTSAGIKSDTYKLACATNLLNSAATASRGLVIAGSSSGTMYSASVTATNALKVDGSAVTQPVSATSLPLPTGAATAEKQPSLGAAGTASSDVITVQGIASMTPLLVEFANPAAGGATEETLLDVLDKQPSLGTAGIASSDVITVQGIASMTALKVDGSDVTQPVSATSLPLPTGAATESSLLDILDKQPALGTAGTASSDVITVQGIASMTALKVDGSAVTQPVSATSLPLPTGAATAAKQPALGTAGTASSDVITVQGIASMTALKVDGSAVTQPVSATSLPLPTGAATETTLSSLNTKTPSLGQALMTGSTPVVIASNQSSLPVSFAAKTAVDFARLDYSVTNVTTTAYVTLDASLAGTATEIEIFDSSGQTLLLATGAAGTEVDKIYIIPGGNGKVSLGISSGVRVAIKAVSATANSGEIIINFYG